MIADRGVRQVDFLTLVLGGIGLARPLPVPVAIIAMLAGCAPLSTIPPEQRTTVVQASVPLPVPCFTEDQRPVAPVPTPIDPETATTEQLAAAELADAIALADYAAQVDRLFIACTSKGTP